MSDSRAISSGRALWVLICMFARRQRNMLLSRRKRTDKKAARDGTPSKGGVSPAYTVFLFATMLLSGFFISSMGIGLIASAARDYFPQSSDGGKIFVQRLVQKGLQKADDALKQMPAPADGDQSEDAKTRREVRKQWFQYVDAKLRLEFSGDPTEADRQKLLAMHDAFVSRGAAAFAVKTSQEPFVSAKTWPRESRAQTLFRSILGVVFFSWPLIMVCLALGANNKDLGQVEWSFTWLYTLPVPAAALFSSKWFSYSFMSPLAWCFFFPYAVLCYLSGGYKWPLAILFGFAAMVYLSLLAGAFATVFEVLLRKYLSLSSLKNLQAGFTLVGTLGLLTYYAMNIQPTVAGALVKAAAALPVQSVWNPFSLALIPAMPGASAWQVQMALALMTLSLAVAGTIALAGSGWLTRDGLVKAGGPYQGTRQKIPFAGSRGNSFWTRGVAGQELVVLSRDRNLLMGVIITPVLVVVFNIAIRGGAFSSIAANFNHAAAVAFGICAYLYIAGAMTVLAREQKTIWHLLTFPRSLMSILLEKTRVWMIIGLLYACAALAIFLRMSKHLDASAITDCALVLYGAALYAFLAAGIGILATNTSEAEPRRQMNASLIYLYMVLAGMYINTIYTPSAWAKIAQIILSTLLAYALWQKVRDACPYILDPVDKPPRTLSLADGMIAILGFFVLQTLIALLLGKVSDSPMAEQTTMAYAFAGIITVVGALLAFHGEGVKDLFVTVGLTTREHAGKLRALAMGVGYGLAAAAVAFLYLHALALVPAWQAWQEEASRDAFLARGGSPLWACLLAVVAAPLCEEFLFRGLIFQGLRRTTTPLLAVLGSAALFAIVHPPVAVIPVFALGLATALCFRRSHLLLGSIVTHAVYNACVLFVIK